MMGTPHKTIFIARFKQYILRQHRVRFGSKADMCSAKGHVRFFGQNGYGQSPRFA